MTHLYTLSSSRVGWMAEVRESTQDQTPGPSRARWMEGGGTVRLHHQHQLGLFTALGICMRTLRIPSEHTGICMFDRYTCDHREIAICEAFNKVDLDHQLQQSCHYI